MFLFRNNVWKIIVINYITKAYRDYISKYNSSPDLLFIGEKTFAELMRGLSDFQTLNFSPKLQEHTIYGCLIIKVPSHSYGYNFYEFDDLDRNKDIKVLYGRELVIEKFALEDSVGLIGNAEFDPKATNDRLFLTIPLEVLETFKKHLSRGLQKTHVKEVNSVYKDILEINYKGLHD